MLHTILILIALLVLALLGLLIWVILHLHAAAREELAALHDAEPEQSSPQPQVASIHS